LCLFNVTRLVRLFLNANILLRDDSRDWVLNATFEVENVRFYCTERVVVANVNAICTLHLAGLWNFLNNRYSLRILLDLWFMFWDRWWRGLNYLSRNWLSLIKLNTCSFFFFFCPNTSKVKLSKKLVYWLSFIKRITVLWMNWFLIIFLTIHFTVMDKLFLIKNLKLTFLNLPCLFCFFQQQVITSCSMVVLIRIYTLYHILSFKIQHNKLLQDHRINRNLWQTYENSTNNSI
jgi:hypothetical protein